MGNVAVFSVAGGFCATQAMCTHRAGPLSEGAVDDTTVTCPLHGAQFNIWTGAVLRGPATTPLKTYRGDRRWRGRPRRHGDSGPA